MRALFIVVALFGCEKKASTPSPLDGVELPDVTGSSFLRAAVHEPIVTVSKTGISYNGTSVAAIANGAVDAADKTDGANGLKIQKLSTALAGPIESKPPPSGQQTFQADGSKPPLQLAIDKTLTFGILFEVMYSAKQTEAGYKSFQLLARTGSKVVQVPITLPDKKPRAVGDLGTQIDRIKEGGVPPTPDNQPLGLMVTVSKDEIMIWSVSQLEGSLKEPKARIKLVEASAIDQVQKAISEIATRRWGGQERPESTTEIVLQADRTTSMQRIADLLGAIRPSFPDVRFSSGFE